MRSETNEEEILIRQILYDQANQVVQTRLVLQCRRQRRFNIRWTVAGLWKIWNNPWADSGVFSGAGGTSGSVIYKFAQDELSLLTIPAIVRSIT